MTRVQEGGLDTLRVCGPLVWCYFFLFVLLGLVHRVLFLLFLCSFVCGDLLVIVVILLSGIFTN